MSHVFSVDKLSDMDSEILNNDMEKVVQYISSLQGAKVNKQILNFLWMNTRVPSLYYPLVSAIHSPGGGGTKWLTKWDFRKQFPPPTPTGTNWFSRK